MKQIGKQAFKGCKKLKNITIQSQTLKKSKVGSAAFKGISAGATVKVPAKKKSAYKAFLYKKGLPKTAKIK